MAGCVPATSGLACFMLLLTLVFRVQISAALFAWGLTRLFAVAFLAPWFESMGEGLLERPDLEGFWTFVLNLPVIAWFGLHSYAILGGAVVGLLVGAVLFVPVRLAVASYRRWLHAKVSQNKFFRWFTNFWIVKVLRFVLVGARS
jgi:uncharacterized protein (TIGR03546 family)